jgi:molybdopterin/thiamine biosynthesis adenylyltransferase/rhodanese-related sulfurtransferase
MPGYRELLAQLRAETEEVDASTLHAELEAGQRSELVDVRAQSEWDEGHLPGAHNVGRDYLESRTERLIPDRETPIVIYCESGNRSLMAAKTLRELGYTNVRHLSGGYVDWKRDGYEIVFPKSLTPAQRQRYARHILVPEVGEEGQLKLLESRVLMIGAGGLGSPAALYLAAAGVGTLGIVDGDIVDESNLQRQIVHSTQRLGQSKALSAKETIEALNPDVNVITYEERISSENIERILADKWDVILDGTDNFPTRYLLNDASVWHRIPVVHGSILSFEGFVSVFKPFDGPCYRCLYPEPPPPEMAPSCSEAGVLGVLPGIIGTLQANEVIKLLLEIGDPLVGRLLRVEALDAEFMVFNTPRNKDCPVCGDHPTITEYIDYVQFCQAPTAKVSS